MAIRFRVIPKHLNQFCQNWFGVKISIFLNFYFFYPVVLKTTGIFKFWPFECTNYTHFSIIKDASVEYRNILTNPKVDDRQKKNTHYVCKTNTFIAALRI